MSNGLIGSYQLVRASEIWVFLRGFLTGACCGIVGLHDGWSGSCDCAGTRGMLFGFHREDSLGRPSDWYVTIRAHRVPLVYVLQPVFLQLQFVFPR